jgi:pimeloyl-ACP methyl ester carboxylesterase
MRFILIISLLFLSSCNLNPRRGSISSQATSGEQTLVTPSLAVIVTGFQAPQSLYQTFEAEARKKGIETLIISLPADGISPFRQDESLAAALNLVSAQLSSKAAGRRDLYLFGHSLGGKIVTTLALLNASNDDRELSKQLGGHVEIKKDMLNSLQNSLKGVFLLDPVYEGVDTNLVKRMEKVTPASEQSAIRDGIRKVDSMLVSLPIEDLKPRPQSGRGFKTLIVQAELGNKGKSVAELTRTAQILRPKLGPVIGSFEPVETAVAKQIKHSFPACGPDFLTEDSRQISSSMLAFELFAQRTPVAQISATTPEDAQPSNATAQTKKGSNPVNKVRIAGAGHMDVVNLQPYQHEGHDKFIRLCATGPRVLDALESMRAASAKDSMDNPYHAQALDLWKNFLGE